MRIIQTDPDEGKHLVEISTGEVFILLGAIIMLRLHSGVDEDEVPTVMHLTDKLNRIIP